MTKIHWNQQWLSLQDYSSAYKVSTSTLRRRIKAGEIEFRMKDGKYFLKNDRVLASPSLAGHTFIEKSEIPSPAIPVVSASAIAQTNPSNTHSHAILEKQLQEKDNEVLSLKKEIADLKTLVQILESELKREKFGFGNAPIDEWIDNKEFLVKKEK